MEEPLPHWDLTSVFPALDSGEFEAAFDDVAGEISSLKQLFDRHAGRADVQRETFEDLLGRLNSLLEQVTTVNAYLYALVTTEAENEPAQAKYSELQASLAELTTLETRFAAWIGSLDVEALISESAVARDHAFFLKKTALESRHQMSLAEEELAAVLSLSGTEAWSKLHSNVTSLLTVDVAFPDGDTRTLPMSAVRALAHDPDEGRRKAAYHAELEGWKSVEVPLAAALNGLKGAGNALNERRSWPASIEPSLFINNTDMATLEALQAAVVESFPDFRRYLKLKAGLVGKQSLPWWDLHAPAGPPGGVRRWTYPQAADFIREQFGTFSRPLSDLAARAFSGNWIDAEPRAGKQQGGYCMTIRGEESRILVNFEPSFDALQTLAHELGHAYHHFAIAGRTPLQRKTPMALAETASTFCQAIVFNAALEQAEGDEALAMLESSLQDACSYTVDIHSRFLFEKAVYQGRRKRELGVGELNGLMLECQRQTYGDGLDGDHLHPYMWAAKVHYYMPDLAYYNWPYTFGMLFSLGLLDRYLQDPADFPPRYDDLLSSTGMADSASLAARFGIDIRSAEFWRGSLDVCRRRIDRLEEIARPDRSAHESRPASGENS